jgi:hypothetical protein
MIDRRRRAGPRRAHGLTTDLAGPRLLTPLGPTGGRGRAPLLIVGAVLAISVAAVFAVAIASSGSSSDPAGSDPGVLGGGLRLIDTSSATPADDTVEGGPTEPGRPVAAGSVVELEVAGRDGIDGGVTAAAFEVAATGHGTAGTVTAYPCGADQPDLPQLRVPAEGADSRLVLSALGSDGRLCLAVDADLHLTVDVRATFDDESFDDADDRRLLDTRPGSTASNDADVDGPLAARTTLQVPVGDAPADGEAVPGTAVLEVTVIADERGTVTLHACDAPSAPRSRIHAGPGRPVAALVLVDPGPRHAVCVRSTTPTNLVIDRLGTLSPEVVRFGEPTRLVDTTPEGRTADGRNAGTGVRPARSTLQVPVTDHLSLAEGTDALLVNVTARRPLEDGDLLLHAPSAGAGAATPALTFRAGETTSGSAIVPLDPSGRICVATTGATDLVLDVVGVVVGDDTDGATTPAPADGDGAAAAASGTEPTDCPAQSLFPHWRIVAIYGTDRSDRLGVLGEQGPQEAARRLAEIAAPYEQGDRPVLPAFELIATLATADPGEGGLHRLPASEDFVQRYLDAARRHGIYLILDIQPGRSDFLTEAKRYERFLREPDVGLALDPEWRTAPPATPGGGHVGQVDAAEVNAVAEWLAGLVAEEDLPEKLLVVHQFQERMITNRETLREPPGIALTIHMDGHGTRAQKLDTYSKVRVDAPWHNALKLFYDEDVDMYRPEEVLGGAFQPVPELVTYQ